MVENLESNSRVEVSSHRFLPSTGRRLWARCIDQMILSAFWGPALYSFASIGQGTVRIPVLTGIGLVGLPLAYEALGYYFFSATAGKWIFSLKVEPLGSAKGWFVRCWLRALMCQLSLFFMWAIYATALFRKDRRHLGDWVAESHVTGVDPSIKPFKTHPIFGTLLVFLGVSLGWQDAKDQIRAIRYEDGFFLFENPFQSDINFEFNWDDEEDEFI